MSKFQNDYTQLIKECMERVELCGMEFPITDLLDPESCAQEFIGNFPPDSLRCQNFDASVNHTREFRTTKRSQQNGSSCRECDFVKNLY